MSRGQARGRRERYRRLVNVAQLFFARWVEVTPAREGLDHLLHLLVGLPVKVVQNSASSQQGSQQQTIVVTLATLLESKLQIEAASEQMPVISLQVDRFTVIKAEREVVQIQFHGSAGERLMVTVHAGELKGPVGAD